MKLHVQSKIVGNYMLESTLADSYSSSISNYLSKQVSVKRIVNWCFVLIFCYVDMSKYRGGFIPIQFVFHFVNVIVVWSYLLNLKYKHVPFSIYISMQTEPRIV